MICRFTPLVDELARVEVVPAIDEQAA